MIEIDEYYPYEDSPYKGNPLITYFPPLDLDSLAIALSRAVRFPEGFRTHAAHLRLTYLPRVSAYFVPLDHMVDFAFNVYSQICYSYSNRNPLRPNKSKSFKNRLRSIADGTQQPATNEDDDSMPWGVTLIGTPGTGKGSIFKALERIFGPETLHHKQHGQLYQVVLVTVSMSTGMKSKSVAKAIFEALRKAASGTPHFVPSLPSAAVEVDYTFGIEILCRVLNLGLLVLDEIQHLYNGTGGLDKATMTFLTGLSNCIKAPIAIVGTWEALPLLSQEGRLGRRSFSLANGIFRRMVQDETWEGFLLGLFRLQVLQHPVAASTLSKLMYYHCQGIADVTVKFFVLCQSEAIADGSETLTPGLLNQVADKHMKVLAPWIELMRSGLQETDIRISDAEPIDFEVYLQAHIARVNIRRAKRSNKGLSNPALDSWTVSKVAEALVAADVLTEQAALQAAEAQVKRAPHRSTAEHLQKALECLGPRAPKRTHPVKPAAKKKELESFSELEDRDVRKIVYFALHDERDVEAALRDAGHLCSVTDDLDF